MSSSISQGLRIDVERAVKLQSGEILHIDYRDHQLPLGTSDHIRPLKAVQWNIERGIKLDGIITQLRELDADIIALQEVDCGLSRSEYLETGIAIAHQLKLNYVFQNEFHELEGDIDKKYFFEQVAKPLIDQLNRQSTSDTIAKIKQLASNNDPSKQPQQLQLTRNDPEYQTNYRKSNSTISTTLSRPHDPKIQFHPTPVATNSTKQYGTLYSVRSEGRTGVHGNAILTKFDISKTLPLHHQHHPYNWSRDGILLNEPRTGERQTLCCVVEVPVAFVAQDISKNEAEINHEATTTIKNSDTIYHAGHIPLTSDTISLPVYTCHLELFCGLSDRLKIMGEIFKHFRQNFGDSQNASQNQPYGLILGDFNTLAHSIARFSPKYCKDELRWKTLGYTEAEWWYRFVLDTTQYRHLLPASSQYKCIDTERNYNQDSIALYNNGSVEVETSLTTSTPLADLKLSGLTQQDCLDLINPGFLEPFDPQLETLTNYSGWFYGKLDWVLTMGVHTVRTGVFDLGYEHSDHRGLQIDFWLKSNPALDTKYRNVLNSLTETLLAPKNDPLLPLILPPKPYIPSHLQSLFVPRVYFVSPRLPGTLPPLPVSNHPHKVATTAARATNLKVQQLPANGVVSVQVSSHNDAFTITPLVIDFAHGYFPKSSGAIGFLQRNITPFVQQLLPFLIPTIVALIYILLLGGSD